MIKRITSRTNPRLKEIAGLHRAKNRRDSGYTLAEGFHLVAEALKSGLTFKTLVLSEKAAEVEEGAGIINEAAACGIQTFLVPDHCLAKISELKAPEGAIGVIQIPKSSPDLFFTNPKAQLVILAGVQDPGNAGAVLRVAEAAGINGAIFIDGVDPTHPKTLRGSMGSSFRLPVWRTTLSEFIERIKDSKLRIIGTAKTNDSIDYNAADYSAPVALVLGSEGGGVPSEILEITECVVEIPMCEPVESLNVSVASGVLFYRARRDWLI